MGEFAEYYCQEMMLVEVLLLFLTEVKLSRMQELHYPSKEYHQEMVKAGEEIIMGSSPCKMAPPGCSSDCPNNPTRSYYSSKLSRSGMRVVLANGIPDHQFERDAEKPNPNRACQQRLVMALPTNQSKGTYRQSPMGPVGVSVTGGFIFNHLSSPGGNLAVPFEAQNLDSCRGHSEPSCRYHYHDVNLIGNCHKMEMAAPYTLPYFAPKGSACYLVGWMRDGFPLLSCVAPSGETILANCYRGNGDYASGYWWDPKGKCHLDQANGFDFPEGYAYVVTSTYPWVPPGFMGASVADICYLDGSTDDGIWGRVVSFFSSLF